MVDDRPQTMIEMLEQVRAELETALSGEAHWCALRQATVPANRAALERALASNPVYRAWELLRRTMEAVEAERTAGSGISAAAGEALPASPRPRVELRHVLERIRRETAFDSPEPGGGAMAAPDAGAARPAGPVIAPADIEIEEAAVSFVIREPLAPGAAAAAGPATAAGIGFESPAPAAPAPPTALDDDDGEAEVTIVPRRR